MSPATTTSGANSAPPINLSNERYRLLLEQRNILIGEIQDNKKSFHVAIFSTLTLMTACLTYFLSSDYMLSFASLFLFTQVALGLSCFISAILFSMNNDRDCIRAIDKYLEERYQIDVLFYQGEFSYDVINYWSSPFSLLNMLGLFITIMVFIYLFISGFSDISVLLLENLEFTFVIVAEIIVILMFWMRNLFYKKNKHSHIYDQCLEAIHY